MTVDNGHPRRRAAVVGSPIQHSLSPVLHRAAYVALELTDWSYERLECDAERLPALVAGLEPEWVGLSVTMPGKKAALELSEAATTRARAVGAANTLVRVPGGHGWQADCTDIDGVVGALRSAAGYLPRPGAPGVVLGAGGTASAALAAFAELGITEALLVVREPARAADALACAERVGLAARAVRWAETDLRRVAGEAAALVSTVPAEATAGSADDIAAAPCLLDAVYHPWPTPLAEAVGRRGGRLGTGLDMLLHQAFGQVEQFTGLPAPREAMREALRTATHDMLPLPL
jgi:shikimate dehydrogenase